MNTLKKTICLAALMLGLAGNTFAAEPAGALPSGTAGNPVETLSRPAKEYASALRNLMALESGIVTVDTHGKFPLFGDVLIHNVITLQIHPIQGKSVSTMTSGVHRSSEMTGYIEQTEDGKSLTLYRQDNHNGKEQWVKRQVPLTFYDTTKNPDEAVANSMKYVKSIKKDYKNNYTVDFDLSGVYKPGDEKKWGNIPADQQKVGIDILTAIAKQGTFTSIATIDSKENRITKLSIPLTELIRNVGNVVIENAQTADEASKLFMKGILSQSQVDVEITIDPAPEGTDFSIPLEVKKSAVEEKDIKKDKKNKSLAVSR